jgi:hypothetical protein
MSINIIKIVLETEFDLTITHTQIKYGEDSISTKEILSDFNTNITRHPLMKEQSWIELLSFNSPSLLIKLNQLAQGVQYSFLEKGAVQRTSVLMNSTTRSCDNMTILLERQLEYHEPPVYH